MPDFIDYSRYVDFLEKEIQRLTIENNEIRQSTQPLIFEHSLPQSHPPLTWQLPRKASMVFKENEEFCKDAVLLSWGDFSKTLYMDSSMKYSMDAMSEMCQSFFYSIAREKINKLKRNINDRRD